jgi:hypothetical protein
MICANCGCDIHKGDTYYKVKDNYLLVKYFDSDEDSIFCSQDCLCEALSADMETCEEPTDEDKDFERILKEAENE